MPDFNFDPSAAVETYRSLFAPTLRAQQEALKTIEYAVIATVQIIFNSPE